MTRGELETMSGAEVTARLAHRGVPVWVARWWVERRDDEDMATKILRVLNMKRRLTL